MLFWKVVVGFRKIFSVVVFTFRLFLFLTPFGLAFIIVAFIDTLASTKPVTSFDLRRASREICGGELGTTTNNRMEITTAIQALELLADRPCKIRLHTDSTYLCNGAKKCTNTESPEIPTINEDLWKRLRKASIPHRIEWN